MNNKGLNSAAGFGLLMVLFLLVLTSFITIEPLKEALDNTRGNSALNCPGTPAFNQTDYNDDNSFERLVRRPTCFVTGISMVYFILSFIIAAFVWLVSNWRKLAQK